jgi:hypothetical protein
MNNNQEENLDNHPEKKTTGDQDLDQDKNPYKNQEEKPAEEKEEILKSEEEKAEEKSFQNSKAWPPTQDLDAPFMAKLKTSELLGFKILIGLSLLILILGPLVTNKQSTLEISLHFQAITISSWPYVAVMILWILNFMHVGFRVIQSWGKSYRNNVLIFSTGLCLIMIWWFWKLQMAANPNTDFLLPEFDEEAMKIIEKQRQNMQENFKMNMIPFGMLFAFHAIRTFLLYQDKSK